MIRLTTQVALVASLASLAKGSPITDGLKNTIHSINITKSYTEMAMTDFIEREKIRRESFATSAAVAGSVPAPMQMLAIMCQSPLGINLFLG
ncbi:uncharacterized protein EI90DRAFT_2082035 [Cantharellus anzutake]|uniref:uncharacterized protein n=1 Tax=Cantharellus anzutake TaxID=1750568 RepID=UPI001906302B|nr:uncharacterized protein EI90DRAFT_2082035 [Cantharellus anzutake]KAF8340557.1 hypothetical protein EI90DRAFT_2082035 [Cantharellus anzutake]